MNSLPYVEIHLVDHCNLNCRGCNHYSPLVKEPWFLALEEFEKDVRQLAKITNGNIDTFCLLGGEPLLHPQLLDFVILLNSILPQTQIQIFTNGILLQKQEDIFFEIINKYNVLVIVTDYHLNLDCRWIDKLKNNLRIDDREYMYNLCLSENGNHDGELNYRLCEAGRVVTNCVNLRHGRLYTCAMCCYADYLESYFNIKLANNNINENSISIYDSTLDDIYSYLNQSIPFCKNCNFKKWDTYEQCGISKREKKEWIEDDI